MILEKHYLSKNKGEKYQENILFFGNRYEKKDGLYCELFKKIQNEKNENFPFELITAFSRDQEKKEYVQHSILKNSQKVYELLFLKNGYFLISGNSKDMPKDVLNTLKNVIKMEGNFNDDETDKYFKKLEDLNRIQV
jgi:sulfite reductase alpha subunit-like flavoprotein